MKGYELLNFVQMGIDCIFHESHKSYKMLDINDKIIVDFGMSQRQRNEL